MIKYAIPGMYELKEVNFKLLELMEEHPEFFYDDVEVEIIYGNPQFCIWDGGRIFNRYRHTTTDELTDIINIYNHRFNKPVRYVFTSAIITPELCKDHFGNILLQIGNNYHNEVVLVSDDLLNHIKDNYKNYKIVSSTTKCLTDKEALKQELHDDRFKLVCLDYNHNKNIKFLETFTPEEVEKSEFLINAICGPGCPHRKDHYYLNSMNHLNYGREYKMEGCAITTHSLHPNMKFKSNNLTYEEIRDVYAPMGFEHFKIEGRTWSSIEIIMTYCEYMVKPEWQSYVAVILQSGVKNEL